MFRIGEFARLTRVSIRMLRHYDRLGLLTPAHVEPSTGYRYYRATQLPALNRILVLRELGFSLREIAGVVDDPVYRRREADLLAQLDATARQLTAVRARRALPDETDVVIRRVRPIRVATISVPLTTDVEQVFDALETHVANRRARADQLPLTLIDAESVTVAVPVSRPVDGVRLQTLPAATVACVVHNGPYVGLARRMARMAEWLTAMGYEADGPLREVYLRFGASQELGLPPAHVVDDTDPDYVTELQLPVRAVSGTARR